MKKLFLLIVFFQLSCALFSQKDLKCYIDFENNNYCYQDTLIIDYLSNPNNIWEIGTPNKPLFNAAYSQPNAIATDLDSVYPVNDTSSFIITHIADMALTILGEMRIYMRYWVVSDTLTDYGSIEFSPDNGHTWLNALTDTTYFQYLWHPTPVLSGNSHGWQQNEIWFRDINHDFSFVYGDTTMWRFTFISDSVQTNKEGWMLDNIFINDWFEGIPELQQNIKSISPNPFYHSTLITLNQNYRHITLDIYNLQGQKVAEHQYADCSEINLQRGGLAEGMYFLKLTLDGKMVETRKIIISE